MNGATYTVDVGGAGGDRDAGPVSVGGATTDGGRDAGSPPGPGGAAGAPQLRRCRRQARRPPRSTARRRPYTPSGATVPRRLRRTRRYTIERAVTDITVTRAYAPAPLFCAPAFTPPNWFAVGDESTP